MTNEGNLPAGRQARMMKEIVELVARVTKIPQNKINLESDLFSDLGVDSMTGIEIFSAIDKKYNLDVPEEKLKSVKTVGDLVQLVNNLI